MKIFLKFFIFLVNQEANGYSCLLQCQGQKTENRVRENDRIFMDCRNDFQIFKICFRKLVFQRTWDGMQLLASA